MLGIKSEEMSKWWRKWGFFLLFTIGPLVLFTLLYIVVEFWRIVIFIFTLILLVSYSIYIFRKRKEQALALMTPILAILSPLITNSHIMVQRLVPEESFSEITIYAIYTAGQLTAFWSSILSLSVYTIFGVVSQLERLKVPLAIAVFFISVVLVAMLLSGSSFMGTPGSSGPALGKYINLPAFTFFLVCRILIVEIALIFSLWPNGSVGRKNAN